MSALVEKLAVYDSRIIQPAPTKYAVSKGALSVSASPYNAISANASQHLFQINVPSQNVYIDRAVDWTSEVFLKLTVAKADATEAPVVNAPMYIFGADGALCPFPLTQMCNTITATINDSTVTVNVGDILPELLRLTDYKPNRIRRTCPSFLDIYSKYNDGTGTINNPLSGYGDATAFDDVKNGAFEIVFTDPSGNPLVTTGTVGAPTTPAYAGLAGASTYNAIGGVPVFANTTAGLSYDLYIKFRSVEKLVVSPFIWADSLEDESTGLLGITNIQVQCNIAGPQRVIRSATNGPSAMAVTDVVFNTTATGGLGGGTSPFQGSQLRVVYLTPPLGLPLPEVNMVPYMEYPRYISSGYRQLAPGAKDTLQSQNVVLPCVPDLIYIYARPQNYLNTQGDFHLPITNFSLNFDNFSGLMSSFSQEQLYHCAVNNGLSMDYNLWRGKANKVSPPPSGASAGSSIVALIGGGLLIKPGKDFALGPDSAPGILQNINIQFQIGVENTTSFQVTPAIYMITINSGFVESSRGATRVLRGILNSDDVLNAPIVGSDAGMKRMVGGGIFSSLGNILSKARGIYEATKPAVSCIKEALPEGMAKTVLGKVGYGKSGGMKKMSVADRLM
jgi:hypothetical protein